MPRLYSDSTLEYSSSGVPNYSGVISFSRTGINLGQGSESSTRVITRLRTSSGSGTSFQIAYGYELLPRTASGSGIGSDFSTRLVTRFRDGSSSSSGSSSSIFLHTIIRTANSNGNSFSNTTSFKIFFRLAYDQANGTGLVSSFKTTFQTGNNSASGDVIVALWVNKGVTLNENIKMPPFWVDARPKFVRRIR